MTTPRSSQWLRLPGPALLVCASLGLVWGASPGGLAAPPAPDNAPQKKPAAPATPGPRFETAVLPILRANCVRCHGQKPRRAGLDLSSREGVFQGSESGPVIVPGKVEGSPLFKMVHEGKMPPDKKRQLSDTEVATIRRWIEAGAPSATETGTGRPSVASVTQHDIIPMMLRNCTTCHGGRRREASLDLRTRASMLKGGKSGPALVPGHPERSLILKKVRAGEMPPFEQIMKVSVKPFSASEIERLTQWIALGAPEAPAEASPVASAPGAAAAGPDPLVTDKDRSFWSFRPPAPVAIPAVRDARRVRNPVDVFIQKKLEENGLTLGPETDRLT